MELTADHKGGCACGAIRFSAEGEPVWAAYCHCSDCRQATGAPVTLWVGFRAAAIVWTGTPESRSGSSGDAKRQWCGRCGSPIGYLDASIPDNEIYLAIGAFDEPQRIAPKGHAFWSAKLPFVTFDDGLPRYETFSRARKAATN
ncbi:GFA family protein [Amorphus sp. 3PC139-8]|uniref:GFA family protein n=1 Tax=Amorphus sp. 3PC139-8 TaxID=2735676 RepID=UPI00345DD81A